MSELPTSDAVTQGIRVRVQSSYVEEQSEPTIGRFFFAYHIQVTNEGDEPARLFSRYWKIVDANGESEEVRGPGVVGETPLLAKGESYEYTSFCPLPTAWGTMEGSYMFRRNDGSSFDVEIARFYLVAPEAGS